ncbi:MAG: [LysW]-lysine hydrolase [Chloroflexota bacterium]
MSEKMMMDRDQFIKRLVEIRSLSGEEQAVAQFLIDQMDQLGMDSHIDDAGNAVGIKERPDENGRISQTIILLGHMDTVPGNIPVHIKDGILHGRGSVDAKGPLATFVQATAQAALSAGTRVIVIGAVEEESATSKGARHVATQSLPDFCIIGEPSGWDGVTLGYKGRILIDYECKVPMSHTAGQGVGAAETAVSWWNQLDNHIKRYNETRPKLFDQLIPSLRDFHTASDGLTNSAKLKVGVRLPPDFDIDAYKNQVLAWGENAEIKFHGIETAFQSTRKTKLARLFNRALRQNGVQPKFKVKTGTSDMNVVGPVWQCPIVAYGPGDSSLDHTPEEHLVLSEYHQAIGILTNVLESF